MRGNDWIVMSMQIGDRVVPNKDLVKPFRWPTYTGTVIEVGDGWLGIRCTATGTHVRLRTKDVVVASTGEASTLVYSTDRPDELPDIVHDYAPTPTRNARAGLHVPRRGSPSPSPGTNPVDEHHGVATAGSV